MGSACPLFNRCDGVGRLDDSADGGENSRLSQRVQPRDFFYADLSADPIDNMPEADTLPTVQLFTDGGCSGNPGPGGWAFVLKHPQSGKELENFGAEKETTNNRMELLAVIRGLEALTKPSRVELFTDSNYVGKGLSEWMPKWKANGWRRKEGKNWAEVKNEDLWRTLDALAAKHKLKFVWVAGHSGHEENERCDTLAVAAYQQFL